MLRSAGGDETVVLRGLALWNSLEANDPEYWPQGLVWFCHGV